MENGLSCWAQRAALSSTKCSWLHSSFAEVSTDELNMSNQCTPAISELFGNHFYRSSSPTPLPWGWKGPTALARVQPENQRKQILPSSRHLQDCIITVSGSVLPSTGKAVNQAQWRDGCKSIKRMGLVYVMHKERLRK